MAGLCPSPKLRRLDASCALWIHPGRPSRNLRLRDPPDRGLRKTSLCIAEVVSYSFGYPPRLSAALRFRVSPLRGRVPEWAGRPPGAMRASRTGGSRKLRLARRAAPAAAPWAGLAAGPEGASRRKTASPLRLLAPSCRGHPCPLGRAVGQLWAGLLQLRCRGIQFSRDHAKTAPLTPAVGGLHQVPEHGARAARPTHLGRCSANTVRPERSLGVFVAPKSMFSLSIRPH